MSGTGTRTGGAASLAEQAYQLLEERVVKLALSPGSLVSEAQLIEMTGLGRTPVREAMQRLAQQDLFRVLPRRGLLVAPVNTRAILQVLEARKPLERLIAQRASINARDEQRSGLSAIARDMATAHDDFDGFLVQEEALGQLLDRCVDNPYLTAAVAPLRSHSRRFWYYHRGQLLLADAIAAQAKLARHVARRDPTGAQKAADAAIAIIERLAGQADRLA